jgi:hypothetical protein
LSLLLLKIYLSEREGRLPLPACSMAFDARTQA